MNKQSCIEVINNSNKIAELNNLHVAILFSRCPISDQVEHRIIYSPSYTECLGWLEEATKIAASINKPYVSYLDGEMRDSRSDLFSSNIKQ